MRLMDHMQTARRIPPPSVLILLTHCIMSFKFNDTNICHVRLCKPTKTIGQGCKTNHENYSKHCKCLNSFIVFKKNPHDGLKL